MLLSTETLCFGCSIFLHTYSSNWIPFLINTKGLQNIPLTDFFTGG